MYVICIQTKYTIYLVSKQNTNIIFNLQKPSHLIVITKLHFINLYEQLFYLLTYVILYITHVFLLNSDILHIRSKKYNLLTITSEFNFLGFSLKNSKRKRNYK